MSELDNYRLVAVSIICPTADGPIEWTQHTTRTAKQLEAYAQSVGAVVCKDRGYGHISQHFISVTDVEARTEVISRG